MSYWYLWNKMSSLLCKCTKRLYSWYPSTNTKAAMCAVQWNSDCKKVPMNRGFLLIPYFCHYFTTHTALLVNVEHCFWVSNYKIPLNFFIQVLMHLSCYLQYIWTKQKSWKMSYTPSKKDPWPRSEVKARRTWPPSWISQQSWFMLAVIKQT